MHRAVRVESCKRTIMSRFFFCCFAVVEVNQINRTQRIYIDIIFISPFYIHIYIQQFTVGFHHTLTVGYLWEFTGENGPEGATGNGTVGLRVCFAPAAVALNTSFSIAAKSTADVVVSRDRFSPERRGLLNTSLADCGTTNRLQV